MQSIVWGTIDDSPITAPCFGIPAQPLMGWAFAFEFYFGEVLRTPKIQLRTRFSDMDNISNVKTSLRRMFQEYL